jgi:tRNA (cytosine34-C5)-methyltransferase
MFSQSPKLADGTADGPERRSAPYEEIVRENDNFITYYKHQKICSEDEFEQFIAALKSDLPTTFRVTGSKKEAQALLGMIQKEFFDEYFKGELKTDDGLPIEKPTCLPW